MGVAGKRSLFLLSEQEGAVLLPTVYSTGVSEVLCVCECVRARVCLVHFLIWGVRRKSTPVI